MTINQMLFFAVSGLLTSLLTVLIPLVIWLIKVAYDVIKRLSNFDVDIALLKKDNKNNTRDIQNLYSLFNTGKPIPFKEDGE